MPVSEKPVSEKEVQELKKEVSEMKALISDYIKEAKEAKATAKATAKETFSPDQMKSLAYEIGNNARDFFDNKKDVFSDQKKTCETKIKDNPLASTLIAFIGGAVLAALISKK